MRARVKRGFATNQAGSCHTSAAGPIIEGLPGEKVVTIALAGQPNVGKSTIFNHLTGLSQHVGNWPGKTIEQKIGSFTHRGRSFRVVDLPGTYSLTANSLEEQVTRDYILSARPDLVVAVLDATALERNLYLVAELLFLPSPILVALNMMDVAEEEGIRVEPEVLQAALGLPVVGLCAARSQGFEELIGAIERSLAGEVPYAPVRPALKGEHRQMQEQIAGLIASHISERYPCDWVALKLLEGDSELTAMAKGAVPDSAWQEVAKILSQHEDAIIEIASSRYEWIGRMVRAAVVQPQLGQISLTERLDRWATHPFWGMVLLLGILGMAFWLTYSLGRPLQNFLDVQLVHRAARLVEVGLASGPAWLRGMMAEGIIGGVGTVLTFLPILAIFFALLGLLEDIGYMSRAAFVMDRFMHFLGLHGKSFLPLFLGFGCNVPAVMGTRVIESPRARLLTILLAPLVPCTARLAVLAYLAPAFFGARALFVSWGLVGLNLVVLALAGVVLDRAILRGERMGLIMELPLYHRPHWRNLAILVWQRIIAFLKRAGTVILVVSIIVWLLAYFPSGRIETSALSWIGRGLSPLGNLMGLDWRMMVALLASFVAKENSIATLGVLLGTGEGGLGSALQAAFTPAAGLAFLVVQMLFIPCVATVATMRLEMRSWRWTLFGVGFLLAVSLVAGIIAYHLALLMG